MKVTVDRGLVVFWTLFLVAVSIYLIIKRDTIRQVFNSVQGIEPQSFAPEDQLSAVPSFEADDQQKEGTDEEGESLPEQPRTNLALIEELLLTEPLPTGEEALVQPIPETPPPQDITLYLSVFDGSETVRQVKMNRSVPRSTMPLTESLRLLFRGPTTEEINRGVISFIPSGTTLVSASIRDGLATVNISEELQYNEYGVEGHINALQQIVWTVTEFPTVHAVQILIAGKRMDYLSEGVWIGSPLDRDSFV
ncbi:MAG: GerMN domain-containing protein [Treponema sp.]|jgi:spore germination protein GerM|nr:GerMN domain-containing protein [Treponema sp.]